MTFILTLGNHEQVIQVSDRRLSWDGSLVDDESNKAGILLCRDARHVFGYTGLAKYEAFDTRRWLLDALYDCCPPDYLINSIMPRLKDRATKDFQTVPTLQALEARRKRLSIMFSGYNYYGDPPLSVYGILTNYQNFITGKDDLDAWDHFKMHCWSENRPLDHAFTFIQRIGTWPVMTDNDESSLRELLLESKPAGAIADKATTLVREMADRPRASGMIGKQLSVVVLPRDITMEVLSRYYPTAAGFKMYAPDYVVGISNLQREAVADLTLSIDGDVGPEVWAIPKVRMNAPCPCKNGKRYKDCHGRRKSQPNRSSEQRTSEAKTMRVALRARREKGVDLSDKEMMKLIRENWSVFAPLGYGQYLEKGRGAIFINLTHASPSAHGTLLEPIYIADGSEELEARGGWPEDEGNKTINLIATYKPDQMIVLIFTHRSGRVNTMYMGCDDPNFTPRRLYEITEKRAKG